MRFGVTIFSTDLTIDPAELAFEAEARGFDSIWLPEHTHIPVSRETPPPGGEDELPEHYARSLDPLIALATAASRTSTIRLGTGVMLPAQREPIVTAKAVATLDHLSGGRVSLGIGFGWNREELADHGVAFADRRAVCREHILAMRQLWTAEEASVDGTHVSFGPSWSWPKPVGRVPVLIGGGDGPKIFGALVDYADGWIPIGRAGLTAAIPRLHAALSDAGRDPGGFEVIPFGSLPTPDKLDHFERIGVTECVFRLPGATRDEVLPELDRQAELVASRRQPGVSP